MSMYLRVKASRIRTGLPATVMSGLNGLRSG